MDYTITLTDVEKLAMEYECADVDEWITNAAQNRARIAKEEILRLNTAHCNANSIAIAVGEKAQVQQAYDLKVIVKAVDKNNVTTA
tara:strand:+ start:1084 stop:1341 length:258 start_codon:yes stop_codon:yes gene_type:complete